MNDQTHLVFDLEKILINEVKKCLSNTKHFKNVSNNIDSEDVKSYMKKLQSEKSAEIRERNIYETIIDSITVLLGSDKFKFSIVNTVKISIHHPQKKDILKLI